MLRDAVTSVIRKAALPLVLRPVHRQVPRPAILLLLLAVAAFGLAEEDATQKYRPTIVFMTDFGVLDDSVAICKGVMYSISPEVRIEDLTHEVPAFSILDGGRFLYGTTPYYPAGTVFAVVIDPTVGSTRKAIVAKSKRGQYFVLPDNGLLTQVADRDGIEAVREITNPAWMIGSQLSSTFHGRDIFSPVGAHLARGEDWTQVGPEMPVKDVVRLDWRPPKMDAGGLSGEVIATDGPFGNLITNIDSESFLRLGYRHGQEVHIMLDGTKMTMPFVRTFSDVPRNRSLLYIDSRGRLKLAANRRSFAATYGIRPPVELFIPKAQK